MGDNDTRGFCWGHFGNLWKIRGYEYLGENKGCKNYFGANKGCENFHGKFKGCENIRRKYPYEKFSPLSEKHSNRVYWLKKDRPLKEKNEGFWRFWSLTCWGRSKVRPFTFRTWWFLVVVDLLWSSFGAFVVQPHIRSSLSGLYRAKVEFLSWPHSMDSWKYFLQKLIRYLSAYLGVYRLHKCYTLMAPFTQRSF